eukprot:Skav214142  [mRNA]  locus=scaffold1645:151636:155771:- [translate_table: standard]
MMTNPKAPPAAAATLAWAQAAAARVNEDLARMAMAKAQAAMNQAQAVPQPKVMAPAQPKQVTQHPGVAQQVYSSGPVISKEAVLKRPAEPEADENAKRLKAEAPGRPQVSVSTPRRGQALSSSPAEVRAAAARAEGQEVRCGKGQRRLR